MAVFEFISRLRVTPYDATSVIDIRSVRLPLDFPAESIYDPRDHRTPAKPLKQRSAYFHVLKTIFSPGMLSLPMALGNAGLYSGIPAIVIFTIILTYGYHSVIKSLNKICTILQIPHISYRYGSRIAFLNGSRRLKRLAPLAPNIVAFFMFTSQIGHCCVSYLFMSNTISDILEYPDPFEPMFMILLPLMIYVFYIDNLSSMGRISPLAYLVGIIGKCIAIYFFTRTGFNNIDNLRWLPAGAIRCLSSFGNIMFTISNLTVVLAVDKALVDPRHIIKPFGIINVGTLLPAAFGAAFGVMGHMQYGIMDEIVLRSLPRSETLALVANWMYAMFVMLTYPIHVFAATDLVKEVYTNLLNDYREIDEHHIRRVLQFVRPAMVVIAFCLSIFLPYQLLFVTIVGSVAGPPLAIIGPALMEMGLRHPDAYGKYKFFFYANMLLVLVGVIIMGCGFAVCIMVVHGNERELHLRRSASCAAAGTNST